MGPVTPVTDRYRLAGLVLEVDAAEPLVAALVESRLRPLRTDSSRAADVVVEIRGPTDDRGWPARPPGTGRPIYDTPATPIEYFEDVDQLFVDLGGHARLLCTPAQGLIQLSITGSQPGDPVLASHALLSVGLVETLKRFGRYPLHAAGLALRGQGILVPGSSGAGKSTTSVALVRGGFDFLADDTVFLTSSAEGIWVEGFPDEIDVTANTVGMVPELAHLASAPLRPGRDKHSFRVEEVFGVAPLGGCRPSLLITPKVVGGSRSEAVPLAPAEALVALLPNVLLTEPVATQAHLDMLAELVQEVRCLTVRVGSDLDAVAECIAALVP